MRKRVLLLVSAIVICLFFCFLIEAQAQRGRLAEWWERITESDASEFLARQKHIDPEAVHEQPRERDFDRKEKIEIIQDRLEDYPSISEKIGNLFLNVETGEVQYKTESGELIELEGLGDEVLRSLLAQVDQHATHLHVQRINRQIRQMRLERDGRSLPPSRPEQLPRNVRPPARVPSAPRRR